MRKLIADHMVRNKHTNPHVTSLRSRCYQLSYVARQSEKILKKHQNYFYPIIIEAIYVVLKISVDELLA